MWKFIGKTLAGMVLTKEAQAAACELAHTAIMVALKKPGQEMAHTMSMSLTRDQAIAQAQAQAQASATPSRAELIRQAMQVRASKQSLLADLNDEDRAKLVATAMKAFLAEGKSQA